MASDRTLTSLSKSGISRARLSDINEFITCYLCSGYLIDATTLIDCSSLHYFCRSCIVEHVNEGPRDGHSSVRCPNCGTYLANASNPLSSLRSDKNLQDIVYKLVPGLYKSEMQRRKDFYAESSSLSSSCMSDNSNHSLVTSDYLSTPSSTSSYLLPQAKGEIGDRSLFYVPEDKISLSLEYVRSTCTDDSLSNDSGTESSSPSSSPSCHRYRESSSSPTSRSSDRRYLRCAAGMPVSLLKKFIVQKYALSHQYSVDLIYNNVILTDDLTIMDVIYIYSWCTSDPMRFFYRIDHVTANNRQNLYTGKDTSRSRDVTSNVNQCKRKLSPVNHKEKVQVKSCKKKKVKVNNNEKGDSRKTSCVNSMNNVLNQSESNKCISVQSTSTYSISPSSSSVKSISSKSKSSTVQQSSYSTSSSKRTTYNSSQSLIPSVQSVCKSVDKRDGKDEILTGNQVNISDSNKSIAGKCNLTSNVSESRNTTQKICHQKQKQKIVQQSSSSGECISSKISKSRGDDVSDKDNSLPRPPVKVTLMVKSPSTSSIDTEEVKTSDELSNDDLVQRDSSPHQLPPLVLLSPHSSSSCTSPLTSPSGQEGKSKKHHHKSSKHHHHHQPSSKHHHSSISPGKKDKLTSAGEKFKYHTAVTSRGTITIVRNVVTPVTSGNTLSTSPSSCASTSSLSSSVPLKVPKVKTNSAITATSSSSAAEVKVKITPTPSTVNTSKATTSTSDKIKQPQQQQRQLSVSRDGILKNKTSGVKNTCVSTGVTITSSSKTAVNEQVNASSIVTHATTNESNKSTLNIGNKSKCNASISPTVSSLPSLPSSKIVSSVSTVGQSELCVNKSTVTSTVKSKLCRKDADVPSTTSSAALSVTTSVSTRPSSASSSSSATASINTTATTESKGKSVSSSTLSTVKSCGESSGPLNLRLTSSSSPPQSVACFTGNSSSSGNNSGSGNSKGLNNNNKSKSGSSNSNMSSHLSNSNGTVVATANATAAASVAASGVRGAAVSPPTPLYYGSILAHATQQQQQSEPCGRLNSSSSATSSNHMESTATAAGGGGGVGGTRLLPFRAPPAFTSPLNSPSPLSSDLNNAGILSAFGHMHSLVSPEAVLKAYEMAGLLSASHPPTSSHLPLRPSPIHQMTYSLARRPSQWSHHPSSLTGSNQFSPISSQFAVRELLCNVTNATAAAAAASAASTPTAAAAAAVTTASNTPPSSERMQSPHAKVNRSVTPKPAHQASSNKGTSSNLKRKSTSPPLSHPPAVKSSLLLKEIVTSSCTSSCSNKSNSSGPSSSSCANTSSPSSSAPVVTGYSPLTLTTSVSSPAVTVSTSKTAVTPNCDIQVTDKGNNLKNTHGKCYSSKNTFNNTTTTTGVSSGIDLNLSSLSSSRKDAISPASGGTLQCTPVSGSPVSSLSVITSVAREYPSSPLSASSPGTIASPPSHQTAQSLSKGGPYYISASVSTTSTTTTTASSGTTTTTDNVTNLSKKKSLDGVLNRLKRTQSISPPVVGESSLCSSVNNSPDNTCST